MSKDKHPIRDGIIITVVGGLILAGCLAISPKIYEWFKVTISNVWSYLWSVITIPNIVFWVLVLLSIPTLYKPLLQIFRKTNNYSPEKPNLDSYVEDKLFGMTWRWSTLWNNNPSSDLWCFCPQCNTRLIYGYSYGYKGGRITQFECEYCGFKSQDFKGDRENALSQVARQIERRINSGEWKKVVMSKLNSNKKSL